MKVLAQILRAGLLVLVTLIMLTPNALADSGQVNVTDVRASAFPKVTIRFTVTSPNGSLVPVLNNDNLSITEGGKPINQFIVYSLDKSPVPLAVTMAIDVSGSMNDQGKLPAAKAAAETFVSRLRTIDQVELISFSDSQRVVVPFTGDQAAVLRGLNDLKAQGNTVLYDATDTAVNNTLRMQGTRVVIVLTDGEDTASKASLEGALATARQTHVPIYTIGLGSDVKDDVLARMAKETGGRYFKAPRAEDLDAVFAQLTQELTRQYELYYFSPLAHEAGKTVDATIAVHYTGAQAVSNEAHFSYAMPPTLATDVSAPIDPGQLRVAPETPHPVVPRSNVTPMMAALCALGAVLGIFGGLWVTMTRDRTQVRLSSHVVGLTPTMRRDFSGRGGGFFAALLGWLARAVGRMMPSQQLAQLEHNLRLAGNPYNWGVQEFLGVRALTGIALGALAYVYAAPRGQIAAVILVVVGAALGFLLPVIWLGIRIRNRQRAIFRAMPNALDLISATVEAGLGFDQAVSEVCKKWQNDLTHEFTLFLSEMQMGRNRRDALRSIIDRTGVPELSGFVSAVIQADELGAGIARTLAIQAEQIRIKRRQEAEKLAHEATIKMIFPMVFLIFPSIFVVILGPAVPQILAAFQGVVK